MTTLHQCAVCCKKKNKKLEQSLFQLKYFFFNDPSKPEVILISR